jgi:hypothetical protein
MCSREKLSDPEGWRGSSLERPLKVARMRQTQSPA